MKRISNTNRSIYFILSKGIKLQPVSLLMTLEALRITKDQTGSASNGFDGGTGCGFIMYKI